MMYIQTVFANVTPQQAIDHFAGRGIAGFAVAGYGYAEPWGVEPVTVFTSIVDTEDAVCKIVAACNALARAHNEKEYVQTAISLDAARTLLVTVPPDAANDNKSSFEMLDYPVCPNCEHRH